VLEVKAAFTSKSVSSALEHLSDLDHLLAGVDAPGEQFKKFLPQRFFTAIIFFELRNEDRKAWPALSDFVPDARRVWPGGLILRGEGLRSELSATIGLTYSSNTPPGPIGPTGPDLMGDLVLSDSKQFGGTYWSALLRWTSNEFSTFAFDLLAMLNQTYQPGRSSSNYGQSWIDFSKHAPPK
jgi:hypothetical protein